ncbi:MAG: putative sugar nucleotidyl transferase [Planctomycetia bacterium]|nr:putative sugar nucleotidyl transferase [Planctomycetia bacterium]
MHIILFEDNQVNHLYPITTGRAAFSVSIGSLRLLDLVEKLGGNIEPIVRPHLKKIVQELIPNSWSPEKGKRKGPLLIINARTVPYAAMLPIWKEMLKFAERGMILRSGNEVLAACIGEKEMSRLPNQEIGTAQLLGLLEDIQLSTVEQKFDIDTIQAPSDVIRHHLLAIDGNIEYRLTNGNYREIMDGVFVPDDDFPSPVIGEHFISNTKNGPILIEAGVNIGPFCYFHGPVHIGRKSKVIEHSAIKDKVAISKVCKIGGEVEASTVEPYTNKQHHGFLGHSYLGSWVNLGAGTCNSDLKNSYNEVSLETPYGRFPSGMQFLGCVIGDYSKTAINTSIFTGKTIGSCSMVYGFVTTAVPSFVNYARSFGQVTEIPAEVMIQTQSRMFARRNVEQKDADIQLMRDMFELTRTERQLTSEPLSL